MQNAFEEAPAKHAGKKSIGRAGSASCAGPAGRQGGVILRMIPSELDPDLNPEPSSSVYLARRGDLLRRAADSNAPRIPPSQHWWLGGLEGMRDWRAWRGTGIGEAGLGRTQQLSSKQWSKAIRTC